MPRFGLMHYLACFTLFDGDPGRINTVLDGFQAVTPAQVQAAARKYLVPTQSRDSGSASGDEGSGRMSGTTTKPMAAATNAATASQPPVSPVPALGPERPVAWPKRTVRTLPNGDAGGSRRICAPFPKFPRSFFSAAATPASLTARPGLADLTATVVRTGTASRTSRQIEEDLAPHGRRPGIARRRGFQRHLRFPASRNFPKGFSNCWATSRATLQFPAEEFERERAPQNRRLAHRAHHSGISCERTLAPRPFRRASLRQSSRPPKSRSRPSRIRSSRISIATIIRRRTRC